MLLQLFGIFILGLIGGSSPGPILMSAFTEALRKGFLKSFHVIFKALIAESIIAIFVLTLFFLIPLPTYVFYLISLIGVAMLIWIAWQIWGIKKIDGEGNIFSFQKIFLLTIFNGPFWIFWITICVPQAFTLSKSIPGGQFIFLILFEFGWLVGTSTLTFIFSRFRSLLVKTNFVSLIFKTFSLILFFFAAKLLVESLLYLKNFL